MNEDLHKIYELLNGGFIELGFELSKTLLGYNEVDLIELLWVLVGKEGSSVNSGDTLSLHDIDLEYSPDSKFFEFTWIWKNNNIEGSSRSINDKIVKEYINLLKNG